MPAEPVCLIEQRVIAGRVRELAAELRERLEGRPATLLAILKGAVIFAADLARELGPGIDLSFVRARSYGKETESSGKVILTELEEGDIRGAQVVVCDTILDTGLTLRRVVDELARLEPERVFTCVLLDKAERRKVDIEADLVGFPVEDRFLVGYGLDCGGRYRSLPYIAALEGADG